MQAVPDQIGERKSFDIKSIEALRPELETYHLIDRYLRNELAGSELSDFESQMVSDPSFAQEVEMQKLVNNIVIGASYEDLRLAMRQDLAHLDQNPSIFKKWWFWGSSLILILAISWLTFQQKEVGTTFDTKISKADKAIQNESPKVTENQQLAEKEKLATIAISHQRMTKENAQTIESSPIADAPTPETKDSYPEIVDGNPSTPTELSKKSNPTQEISTKLAKEKPDCRATNIHLDPKIEATCHGEKNGKVIFPLQNHSKPLLISMKGSKTGAQSAFYNLGSGDYTFYIVDETGCNFTQQINVPEKSCKSNKFAFNPELGESWKLPISANDEFNLTIHNRGGILVYQHTPTSGPIYEWNGISSQGNQVEAGLYIYVLEFADGRKESGQVSILK